MMLEEAIRHLLRVTDSQMSFWLRAAMPFNSRMARASDAHDGSEIFLISHTLI
jgi:hypothetical protein